MCTCGIDIATQHATPATQSDHCATAGESPNGRDEAASTGVRIVLALTAGGRRRISNASAVSVTKENNAMPS